MSQRLYDLATAEALMKFAYPEYGEHDIKPYEINERGVYVTEAFRDVCPTGTVFDWTPADEMGWAGSPNPDTAPLLPIPFDAAQLAAAMVDGVGLSITHAIGHRLGYPLDEAALPLFPDRMRWVRDALAEAYEAAAAAQSVVGEFDHDQEARAQALAHQYEDANGQANGREGVFQHGITSDEARARRARAAASVAHLKEQAGQARREVGAKWIAWRGAMVRELLKPHQAGEDAPVRPVQRSAAQDAAILAAIGQAGHNPLALPVNERGKPGVKAAIRKTLGRNGLFTGTTVFDGAWERLRKQGGIADRT